MELTSDEVMKRLDRKGYLDIDIPKELDLVSAIKRLKKEKKAVLLAHYYQEAEIQDLADYLGDSLYLAQAAKKVAAEMIVFAGVHFMAETAKIINPTKKVILPDLNAGCSLADSCPPEDFKKFIDQYPGAHIVTYINCSAEIKALSSIVCTSSNAVKVIDSIPDMILWDGSCIVHEAFSFERIVTLAKENPKAKFIAHPESQSQVLNIAHYIGSTSGLLNYVQSDPSKCFIVATEAGILHEMKKRCPEKTFIPAPVQDETCACSECAFMKLNTLEKLYLCLEHEQPEVQLSDSLIEKAKIPITRMLKLG